MLFINLSFFASFDRLRYFPYFSSVFPLLSLVCMSYLFQLSLPCLSHPIILSSFRNLFCASFYLFLYFLSKCLNPQSFFYPMFLFIKVWFSYSLRFHFPHSFSTNCIPDTCFYLFISLKYTNMCLIVMRYTGIVI